MAVHLKAGDSLPEFYYDTPFAPQKSFYELAGGGEPLFVIFLSNFGHPVTRTYLARFCESAATLSGCRLAVVVRSQPQIISRVLPPQAIPFELICDADGALYEYFDIPRESNPLKYTSLDSMKILHQAKKQGYNPKKGEAQQLPLTLLVGPEGLVLLAHYGKTLTDFPEDAYAMMRTAALVDAPAPAAGPQPEPQPPAGTEAEAAPETEPVQPDRTAPEAETPAEPEASAVQPEPLPPMPEPEGPLDAESWIDSTQEILLNFSSLPGEDPQDVPRDARYNTTGEIDIVGLMAEIRQAARAHQQGAGRHRLEDTLSDFEEIPL